MERHQPHLEHQAGRRDDGQFRHLGRIVHLAGFGDRLVVGQTHVGGLVGVGCQADL